VDGRLACLRLWVITCRVIARPDLSGRGNPIAKLEVPHCFLAEHALQLGCYYIMQALQFPERRQQLHEHLVKVHLLGSEFCDHESILDTIDKSETGLKCRTLRVYIRGLWNLRVSEQSSCGVHGGFKVDSQWQCYHVTADIWRAPKRNFLCYCADSSPPFRGGPGRPSRDPQLCDKTRSGRQKVG
jgi:hypothetical protein